MQTREFSLTGVLAQTAGVLPAVAPYLLVLATAVPLLLLGRSFVPRESSALLSGAIFIVNVLAMLITCNLTWQSLSQEPRDLKKAASTRRFSALLGTALLQSLLTFLGLLLLIVPGLILMARWCLAIPASLFEECSGSTALERSSNLTAGHRWQLAALAIPLYLVPLSASLVGVFVLHDPWIDLGLFSLSQFLRLAALVVLVVAYHQLNPGNAPAEPQPVGLTPS